MRGAPIRVTMRLQSHLTFASLAQRLQSPEAFAATSVLAHLAPPRTEPPPISTSGVGPARPAGGRVDSATGFGPPGTSLHLVPQPQPLVPERQPATRECPTATAASSQHVSSFFFLYSRGHRLSLNSVAVLLASPGRYPFIPAQS